jgi:hypothetical protein
MMYVCKRCLCEAHVRGLNVWAEVKTRDAMLTHLATTHELPRRFGIQGVRCNRRLRKLILQLHAREVPISPALSVSNQESIT